jgi:hypothetical protein
VVTAPVLIIKATSVTPSSRGASKEKGLISNTTSRTTGLFRSHLAWVDDKDSVVFVPRCQAATASDD